MTAHNIGSGRSCRRAVSELFLECVDGVCRGYIDFEYFVHGDNPEKCRRLTLTSYIALGWGGDANLLLNFTNNKEGP